MNRKLLLLLPLFLIIGEGWSPAQQRKFEFSASLGYTFSEGVDVRPVEFGDLEINGIDPSNGFSYGFGFDVFGNENVSVGFHWRRQDSQLKGRVRGLGGLEFTDMDLDNFHALFTYNWGDEDEEMRPFFFGGLGATHYGFGSIAGFEVDGSTRFSTTWGGGVKIYRSEHIGFRLQARWTPTSIKTGSSGTWCSPYWQWSCWVVEGGSFSHQFELSGGIVLRY